MGIRDKPIAPASPWQNGFAERLIGSIRHECLDHVIIRGEAHLRRILRSYAMPLPKLRLGAQVHGNFLPRLCGLVEECVPMYMRDGLSAALWFCLSALTLFTALTPLIIWWL